MTDQSPEKPEDLGAPPDPDTSSGALALPAKTPEPAEDLGSDAGIEDEYQEPIELQQDWEEFHRSKPHNRHRSESDDGPHEVSGARRDYFAGFYRDQYNSYAKSESHHYARRGSLFNVLESSTAHRLRAVFVPPPKFRELRAKLEDETIFLLYGEDGVGKGACATRLAVYFSGRVYYCRRNNSSNQSLTDIVNDKSIQDHSAVILTSGFEHEEVRDLQHVQSVLRRRGQRLILIGAIGAEEIASLDASKLRVEIRSQKEILESHIRYLRAEENLGLTEEQEGVLLEIWEELESLLRTPAQIRDFCGLLKSRGLNGEDPAAWQAELKQWAAEAVRANRRELSEVSRSWFNQLHRNEKLLSLLVFLFEGAEQRWLEKLHRHLAERLRREELRFADGRDRGVEDARERLKLVAKGGYLTFADDNDRQEVERQVANRQPLLWDVIRPLTKLEAFDHDETWAEPWKRHALAVGLGKLGRHDPGRLRTTLDEMAQDEEWKRAVIPGVSLQQLLLEDDSLSVHVLLQVRHWILSWDHRRMWAAGAALGRIYLASIKLASPTLKRDVLSLLRGLVDCLGRWSLPDAPSGERNPKRWQERQARQIWGKNFYCIVGEVQRILLADPRDMRQEVSEKWLRSDNGLLLMVARRSLRKTFQMLAGFRHRPSALQQEELPRLLAPLLECASDSSQDVEVMILTLRGWLKVEGFSRRVTHSLLEVVTHSPARTRDRLRMALSRLWLDAMPEGVGRIARQVVDDEHSFFPSDAGDLVTFWCEDTADAAREIAQIVIARANAMDGVLPRLPKMGAGLAVVDSAPLLASGPDEREPSASAVWELLALLESRLDLKLLRLGETTPVLLQGLEAKPEIRPPFARHRLLMPGLASLEEPEPEATRSVFVMAPNGPHDLLDLLGAPALNELVYIGSGEGTALDERGVIHFEMSWPPSKADELSEVSRALREHWARALASGPSDHWLELVRGAGLDESEEPSKQMEECARELHRRLIPENLEDDPVYKAVILTLFWSRSGLSECLNWLSRRLGRTDGSSVPESSQAEEVLARAGAAALIHFYTAYPPDESGDHRAPTLLFDSLAWPLAVQGVDGLELVIRLLDHWLEDRTWTEHLAGDVQGGRGRLQRWTEAYLENRPDAASRLQQRLDEVYPPERRELRASTLAAVVDRLRARQQLKHPDRLPELQPGQRYVWIVVDSTRLRDDVSAHLPRFAVDLYRRLHTTEGSQEEQGLVPVSATATSSNESSDLSAIDGSDEPVEVAESIDGMVETSVPWPPLIPVVFRLGESRPFWASRKEFFEQEDLIPKELGLSRLMGPILQSLESERERVAALLVVSSHPPIDLDDWYGSPWWAKLKLYAGTSPITNPMFSTLPEPSKLPGRDASGRSRDIVADRLKHFLQDEAV